MAYNHGVYVQENPTSLTPPIESTAGLQVVIGTTPVNLADDPYTATNKPILTYSMAEAESRLGYSDNWDHFTACQSMDASFRRLGVGPLVFINVLDPDVHKTDETAETVAISTGEAKIEEEGILLDTLVVKSDDGETTYVKDEDYLAEFDNGGYVVISILDGDIPSSATELQVDYSKLDPSAVDVSDIIGGYDTSTNQYRGLEAISQIYPQLSLVPGILLAPGWSHLPEVASVMDAKSQDINGSFNCINVLDVDTSETSNYQDVPSWKSENSYVSKRSVICWPKVKVGEREFYFSAIQAALMARTDASNDDVPYVSPSNKTIPITAAVSDGEEVFIDQQQANFLNGAGVVTALNLNGWRSWGNNTGAYPGTSDPKDRFIPIRRMFDWWSNTFILTYFQRVDDPTNFRLIENIVDSENIRANGFQARGQIAGAHIEFRREDNPITDILNGTIRFIQRVAFFPPAEEIVNVMEFDPQILEDSLGGDE